MTNEYFASRKSSKPKDNEMLRYGVLLALGVAILVLCLVYSTHVIQNSLVFKPETIYDEGFETPRSSIENLTGAKAQNGLYDVWLRFKCAGGVKLKEQSTFEEKRPSQALFWFHEKFPEDKGLPDQKHLTLLWRTKSEMTKVTNQWLLFDPATATYYYRVWGYE